ncbi:MAG: hypothetical protein ACREEM_01640 [Blastocatellia bacterium]
MRIDEFAHVADRQFVEIGQQGLLAKATAGQGRLAARKDRERVERSDELARRRLGHHGAEPGHLFTVTAADGARDDLFVMERLPFGGFEFQMPGANGISGEWVRGIAGVYVCKKKKQREQITHKRFRHAVSSLLRAPQSRRRFDSKFELEDVVDLQYCEVEFYFAAEALIRRSGQDKSAARLAQVFINLREGAGVITHD